MSEYGAIATVTRTIVQIIQDACNRTGGPIARASVTALRPDRTEPNPEPRVNLFMFHVVPNSYVRNEDLPLLTGSGLLRRPMIAIDLWYLISFYGSDDLQRLEPQLLMGLTMAALNATPILTPEIIWRSALAFDQPPNAAYALPQVQLTLHTMEVEAVARLWGSFAQVPYAPSVCYRASAVMLEADDIPAPPLPVRQAGLAVGEALSFITSVRDADGNVPVYGGMLVIEGRNFVGADVNILMGGVILRPDTVSPNRITVRAAGQGVVAGQQMLHVVRQDVPSPGIPMALAPVIAGCGAAVEKSGRAGYAGKVRLTLQPLIRPGQRLALELFPLRSSWFTTRRSYRFEWSQSPEADASGEIAVPIHGVGGGVYVLRVSIDGAASPLSVDEKGRYAAPSVAIGEAA